VQVLLAIASLCESGKWSNGQQNEYLKKDSLRSINFKLLSQIKGDEINNCSF
jgi:hypothetical protein